MPNISHEVKGSGLDDCIVCGDPAEYYCENHVRPYQPFYRCVKCAMKLNSDYTIWALDFEAEIRAKRKFEDSKKRLVRHHPFYGSMLLNTDVKWVTDTSIPLAAINGRDLFLNATGVHELTKKQWDFLLAHELMHVAHLHAFRQRHRDAIVLSDQGPITLWNLACDYAINWLLDQESDFELPTQGALLDERFADQTPEYIYDVLWQESKKIAVASQGSGQSGDEKDSESPPQASASASSDPSNQQDTTASAKGKTQGGCDCKDGSENTGSGGHEQASGSCDGPETDASSDKERDELSDPGWDQSEGKGVRHVKVDWLHGDILDAVDLDEMERNAMEARIKQITFQAAYHARAIGADKSVANAVIDSQAPRRSWQISLATFVSTTVDRDDYSYRKPHRRYVPQGVYMPTLEGKKPPKLMSVVIDVSSSIRQDQLEMFWEELAGLIALHPNLRFQTYFVNTKIVEERELGIEDLPLDMDVPGYGGTDFTPAFNDIEKKMLDVSGLVYFTDLECNSYPVEPPYPVMWLNFGRPLKTLKEEFSNYGYSWEPPFGEVVVMIK